MTTFCFYFILILNVYLSNCDDSIVNTQFGPIEGNVTSRGRAFTSVPFAAPPIGELRWKPPQPPTPWNKTLQTKSNPPGCIQNPKLGPIYSPTRISEDCLYLNIFTPPVNTNTLHPVMIFYYGGGFTEGYCGGWAFNGTNLAYLTNTIVIAPNYRVGLLGFLYDDNYEIAGNMGYFDSVFAIEWTKNNIEAFGGDPNKITIFGQSAGARNVGLMFADTTIDGLFQNAIMESHGMTPTLWTANDWVPIRRDFYEVLRCHDKECLYNVTSSQILRAQQETSLLDGGFGSNFGPTMGISDNIQMPSLHAVQQNIYNKDVNAIIGVCKNDAWLFEPVPLLEIEYNATIFELAGGNQVIYDDIYAEYPCDNCNEIGYENNAAWILTDYWFNCPARNGSVSIANNNNKGGIYFYHFDHASSFNREMWGWELHQCWNRACHTAELPYVFHYDFGNNATWTQNETILAESVQFYWATLALNGNPGNGQGMFTDVVWTEFDEKNQATMVFEVGSMGMKNHYDTQHCTFWDSLR